MSIILDFTKNSNLPGKSKKLQIFFAIVVQCDRIKHFAALGRIFFLLKNGEKQAFLFKNSLNSCYSCTIATFCRHITKMCLKDKRTATENGIC